jgi:hypothetical protein
MLTALLVMELAKKISFPIAMADIIFCLGISWWKNQADW